MKPYEQKMNLVNEYFKASTRIERYKYLYYNIIIVVRIIKHELLNIDIQ